jgi:Ni/Co efflux regulator RcnB
MKKLIMLAAMSFVFALTLNAQTEKENHLKNDMDNLNKREDAVNKEKREVRQEMRKMDGQEVSADAKQHFDTDFSNTSETRWERTPTFDEVTYTKDGQVSKAYYDNDTKLVGTTTNKIFEDLPYKSQKIINRRYRSYSSGDVLMFRDNKLNTCNMVLYNESFADADNYFVEMKNDSKRIVLRVDMAGDVSYFTQTK